MDHANATEPRQAASRLVVDFAETPDEVRETQRLRYEVFAREMGAELESAGDGLDLDRDRFDPWCRHLRVRDFNSGRVIACTRILTDDRAALAGGFYSAGEFDLEMLQSLPGRVMEVGRTCVAADARNGAVIATLWQGLAGYLMKEGFDYLFGCASIGLEDGGANAHAVLDSLRRRYMAPAWHRVTPYQPLPAADAPADAPVRLPPLIKAYVNLGAKACGDAYWDRDFNCADVFMLLNVGELNPRYARHFLQRGKPGERRPARVS